MVIFQNFSKNGEMLKNVENIKKKFEYIDDQRKIYDSYSTFSVGAVTSSS